MDEYGSIVYALDHAQASITAAKRELSEFDDGTARRALSVAADYMVTRDR
jgi:octaprenyl-diphosphate synthase